MTIKGSVAVVVEVNVREAKARLSELLDRVVAGDEVVIRRRREVVARLVGPSPTRSDRRHGRLRGRIWIAEDFDETPDDIIDMMEGGGGP